MFHFNVGVLVVLIIVTLQAGPLESLLRGIVDFDTTSASTSGQNRARVNFFEVFFLLAYAMSVELKSTTSWEGRGKTRKMRRVTHLFFLFFFFAHILVLFFFVILFLFVHCLLYGFGLSFGGGRRVDLLARRSAVSKTMNRVKCNYKELLCLIEAYLLLEGLVTLDDMA